MVQQPAAVLSVSGWFGEDVVLAGKGTALLPGVFLQKAALQLCLWKCRAFVRRDALAGYLDVPITFSLSWSYIATFVSVSPASRAFM